MRSRRIPLWFGVLKIRHREQLLHEERFGKVPVWAIGNYCFAWWAHGADHSARASSESAGSGRKGLPIAAPAVVRHPVTFAVALRDGQWTIHFDGDYYGPCASKEAALDAAYLMAVNAAAQGLDPQVQLKS